MADRENGGLSNVEESSSPEAPKGSESDTSHWIRNLGQLVTIFGALAGICFTAYQLKQKAQADADVARDNRIAEKDRRDLGFAQIDDQVASRQYQASEHDKDLQADLDKHEADLNFQRQAAANADVRASRDRLSETITHIFSTQASAEGDIASLVQDLNRNPASREIVENTLLARLENPRSKGEVELSLRLLERVGPDALDVIIEANRSARTRYDDCLLARYARAYNQRMGQAAEAKEVFNYQLTKDHLENEISWFSFLDKAYDFASINLKTPVPISGSYPVLKLDSADVIALQQELAATVVKRSNAMLLSMLSNHKDRLVPHVDLTDTYLTGRGWAFTKESEVDLTNAFIDWDSSDMAAIKIKASQTAINSSAERSLVTVHNMMHNSDATFSHPTF